MRELREGRREVGCNLGFCSLSQPLTLLHAFSYYPHSLAPFILGRPVLSRSLLMRPTCTAPAQAPHPPTLLHTFHTLTPSCYPAACSCAPPALPWPSATPPAEPHAPARVCVCGGEGGDEHWPSATPPKNYTDMRVRGGGGGGEEGLSFDLERPFQYLCMSTCAYTHRCPPHTHVYTRHMWQGGDGIKRLNSRALDIGIKAAASGCMRGQGGVEGSLGSPFTQTQSNPLHPLSCPLPPVPLTRVLASSTSTLLAASSARACRVSPSASAVLAPSRRRAKRSASRS